MLFNFLFSDEMLFSFRCKHDAHTYNSIFIRLFVRISLKLEDGKTAVVPFGGLKPRGLWGAAWVLSLLVSHKVMKQFGFGSCTVPFKV